MKPGAPHVTDVLERCIGKILLAEGDLSEIAAPDKDRLIPFGLAAALHRYHKDAVTRELFAVRALLSRLIRKLGEDANV